MSDLLSKVNAAICKVDGCLPSAGYNVVKSATYGRDEAEKASKYDLTSLSLIKNRLERYRDVFLTDNCWPSICGDAVDNCKQKLSFSGTDFVDGDKNLDWFTVSGSSGERWSYNIYNPDRGTMLSMTKVDNDGSFPLEFDRIRFHEWDNCNNTFEPVSGFIDTPDKFNRDPVYLPSEKKYYVVGDDWIMILDENFNVLSTNSYGGSRNWRGFTWDETRKEFYLCDNLGNEIDILDYTTMTITSTTALPVGTPTTFTKVRTAVYRDGGLLLTGWSKAWHMNVDTQAISLIYDDDGTEYYYGTPALDPDGNVVVLRSDIANKTLAIQEWYVDGSFAFPGVVTDLDLEYTFFASTTALLVTIEYDSCGNMILIPHAGGGGLKDRPVVVLYNNKYEKQDTYTDFMTYGQETPFSASYNPTTNKVYVFSNSPTWRMTILDIAKKSNKKVDIYPEMCTPFEEKSVCDLIATTEKLCAGICK